MLANSVLLATQDVSRPKKDRGFGNTTTIFFCALKTLTKNFPRSHQLGKAIIYKDICKMWFHWSISIMQKKRLWSVTRKVSQIGVYCIKLMFGSSLPPDVCRRAHVLLGHKKKLWSCSQTLYLFLVVIHPLSQFLFTFMIPGETTYLSQVTVNFITCIELLIWGQSHPQYLIEFLFYSVLEPFHFSVLPVKLNWPTLIDASNSSNTMLLSLE
jgi:hypothetical protein